MENAIAQLPAFFEQVEQITKVVVPDATIVLSPDTTDLTILLQNLRRARKQIMDAERFVEDELTKTVPPHAWTYTVAGIGECKIHSGSRRDQWDNDNLLTAMAHTIAGEMPVLADPEQGEVVNNVTLVATILAMFTAAATPKWKVTGLRAVHIDPVDYCHVTYGRKTVETPTPEV